jgi:uncharacterized repeat protein (TIGR03803 family)
MEDAKATLRRLGLCGFAGSLMFAMAGCSAGRVPLTPVAGAQNAPAPSYHAGQVDSLKPLSFHTIYTFSGGSDGGFPFYGDLLFAEGRFYGTTRNGGNGCGVVFSLKPNAKFTDFEETTLYAFQASGDACGPLNGLIVAGNGLYGVAGGGTSSNCRGPCGAVYMVPLAGGRDQVLYSFTGGSDGEYPSGALTRVGSNLYGTTAFGGQFGQGAVFRVPIAGGSESVLYSFAGGSDAANPTGRLIYSRGRLYGTTEGPGGGANGCTPSFGSGCGTVFSVPLGGGTDTILHTFTGGADGAGPRAGVTLIGGNLVGTTQTGGPADAGTVFSIPRDGGTTSILHSFSIADGRWPGAVVRDHKGDLYGATTAGGGYDLGTVFRLPLAGGSESVLYSFHGGSDDGDPSTGVIEVNGSLYGATGGVGYGYGTVFQIKYPDR